MRIVFLPRSIFLILFFIFFIVSRGHAQIFPQYHIEAAVDVVHKTINARQTTQWTNTGTEAVNEIVFHIYPNRHFSKKEKQLLWQFAGYFKVNPFPEGFQTGKMQILSASENGRPLRFFVEEKDQTILAVKLQKAVNPGDSVRVDISFSVDIPHITLGRFGWHDNVFRISRWYPILSVYENGKGWNKNPDYPFHRPFYSEAAQYKVVLTVPQGQNLVAPGKQIMQTLNSDGSMTMSYDSLLPLREYSFAMSRDYQVISQEVDGVWMRSFYLPGDKKMGEAAFVNAKQLMKFYSDQFGKYPYKDFSIAPVDLGYGAEQMSNLIFIDRRAYQMPGMMARYFDFLVAHEAGHQWFFNLVGVDEYKEMWLEEGFNSYFIERYLSEKYGEDGALIEFPSWFKRFAGVFPKLTFKDARDTRYKTIARIGMDHNIISELSSFSEPSAIFSVTYGKGARVVGMLKYYLGDAVFAKVFRRIFAEYCFKNLRVSDFIRICEEESGSKLAWFFDAWLYSDKQFNYAVAAKGQQIIIQNRGGITMPAKITVEKKDGSLENSFCSLSSKEILSWPRENIKRLTVDPEEKLLDIDRTDNYWPRRLHIKYVPLYLGLYEIPLFLPADSYSLIAGPQLADNGLGLKVSLQKPYDQILYAASNYEFGEQLQHTHIGYQLKNLFYTQTILGVEISDTKDYQDGDDDLVSGKIFLRRELWPAQYNVADLNDHVSLYLVRNQSINDGADLLSGREGIRNTDYGRRKEAIVGTSLHWERSGTAPDPQQGYKLDVFVENAGHFWGATQSFSRAATDMSFYIPMTAKTKGALRLKYGGGYPDDKSLFFAGGMDGLRGYERKSLRGANMLLGSLEYRFAVMDHLKVSFFDHIVGLETIGGVVFVDAGETWYSAIDSSPLRKDAGVGLRFMVSIGSLFEKILVRADLAQAINDEHQDHPWFWLGINHAF